MKQRLILAGWEAQHYFDIRDLSEKEIQEHHRLMPIVVEARNRLCLFRMLKANLDAWTSYVRSLLSPEMGDHEKEQDELNRLLLNYLTTAYTIREHFEVSYRQRYRNDNAAIKKYDDFISRICKGSWPFAFFLDYRGYVQHRGLAVGRYSRSGSRTEVRVQISADAAQLVRESRDWKKSGLTAAKGVIDLVETLDDFHEQMVGSYASFVVKVFFPELVPAATFYGQLVSEVGQKRPGARMIFHDGEPLVDRSSSLISVKLSLLFVPNDVFGELGIRTQKDAQPGATDNPDDAQRLRKDH